MNGLGKASKAYQLISWFFQGISEKHMSHRGRHSILKKGIATGSKADPYNRPYVTAEEILNAHE